MRSYTVPSLFAALSSAGLATAQPGHPFHKGHQSCAAAKDVDLSWHAPSQYEVNDLSTVLNGTGIYGYIFNSSQGPPDVYNWCNMPHLNVQTYPRADKSYKLEYVELMHRHHKRTPYAANTFPVETITWDCGDEGLQFGGKPIDPYGNTSANTYWSVYTSPANPLVPEGFNGTCQFPQETRGGLDDAHEHGVNIMAVYGDMLGFLPNNYDANVVSYRVTNNVITSQTAAMVIAGMYPERTGQDQPLLIQPDSIDSLEPAYTCTAGSALSSSYGSGSSSPAWLVHINASMPLKLRLDAISGVNPNASDWNMSWDHYFDNLSAKLCHAKPLPCNIVNTTDCVTLEEAEEVFRLGEYEYSFIYRDSNLSLPASVANYGIYIAELAQNLRNATGNGTASTPTPVKYRHNIAHDGSVSPLLSILQVDKMVWPGMGAEVVFELYSREGCYFLRVLWGGQILTSSSPSLGTMDMVPVETVLAYFDGLVGVGGVKVPGLCQTPECDVDGEGCA